MSAHATKGAVAEAPAASEWLWFLGSLVRVQVPAGPASDGMSVIEHRVRQGDSPPLHRHDSEAEIFQVLQGELRMVVDGRELRARAGDTLAVPPGAVHSYCVESAEGAVFVTVTRGPFEAFVRAIARPAERVELPAFTPPSPQDIERLAAVAGQYGIQFVGPPLKASDSAGSAQVGA